MSIFGSSLPSLKISQIKNILNEMKEILSRPDSQGIFLWGPPGIGKSSLVKQFARENDLDMVDLRLPLLDPVDLRGLPMVDSKSGQAKWLPPDFLPKPDAKPGVLFLDEINAAPPAVQASAYQLVLDRKVGNYSLPKGWIIIAAGNRVTDASVAYKLPSALANRFTHFEVAIDLDEWLTWALNNEVDPYIVSFLSYHTNLLMTFDPKKNNMAFATPRAWEFLSNFQHLREKNFPLYMSTIAATVGHDVSTQFIAFLKYRDSLFDPRIILNGDDYEIPRSIDSIFVLMGGVINEMKNITSVEEVDNLFEFIERIGNVYADYSVTCFKLAIDRAKSLTKKINGTSMLIFFQKNPNYTKYIKSVTRDVNG